METGNIFINDGRIEIMPRSGGRLIGLFPVRNVNALWRNPRRPEPEEWENAGGVRVWVSPENELFRPEGGQYRVPPELDPGECRLTAQAANSVTMETLLQLSPKSCNKCCVLLRLTRKITALPPPQNLQSGSDRLAGCMLETVLTSVGELPPEFHPAIWTLIQLSPGGELLVPAARAVPYFGAHKLSGSRRIFRQRVPAACSYKTGFCLKDEAAELGYEACGLSVRWFFRRTPRHLCFDTPPGGGEALPVQTYCDDGELGGFGELEHHSPALSQAGGKIQDTSIIWAAAGDAADNRELWNVIRTHSRKILNAVDES